MKRTMGVLALLLPLVLVGCKIIVVTPPYFGASIESNSGSFQCEWGVIECEIDVVDIFFDETFGATANFGYEFSGWKKRERGLCGGSSDRCRLYTSEFEGRDALLAFLDSDDAFFLEAFFVPLRGTADQMNTVGLWQGMETSGDCSASYVLEIWIEPNVGLFTKAVVPAEAIITDSDGCRVVIAGESRARGPMRSITQPLVTQEHLAAGWAYVVAGSRAIIVDQDSWRLEDAGRVGRRQVLSRITP